MVTCFFLFFLISNLNWFVAFRIRIRILRCEVLENNPPASPRPRDFETQLPLSLRHRSELSEEAPYLLPSPISASTVRTWRFKCVLTSVIGMSKDCLGALLRDGSNVGYTCGAAELRTCNTVRKMGSVCSMPDGG